jgi:hypothetical protein
LGYFSTPTLQFFPAATALLLSLAFSSTRNSRESCSPPWRAASRRPLRFPLLLPPSWTPTELPFRSPLLPASSLFLSSSRLRAGASSQPWRLEKSPQACALPCPTASSSSPRPDASTRPAALAPLPLLPYGRAAASPCSMARARVPMAPPPTASPSSYGAQALCSLPLQCSST